MAPLSALWLDQKLAYLQDLDLLLVDVRDPDLKIVWKKIRLADSGLGRLDRIRSELAGSIGARWLTLYERTHRRHGRAVVTVRDGTCLGCMGRLPTALSAASRRSDSVLTCPSCGCILCWL